LVDDVSRTGKTFEEAKKLLNGASLIKTFVVN
jgi:predicted amidophosphoribosyltransferase